MAIRFDATGDWYDRTTSVPIATAFTIMAWARFVVDRDNYSSFFAIGLSAGGDYISFGTQSSGTTSFLYCPAASSTGAAFSLDTWYHVAMTCAGTGTNQLIAYINGALAINVTTAAVTSK